MSMLHVAMTASDDDVVQRVRRGDRDAYGILVQRHQEALYRYGRGMGLDHDTSLDLVQDAFIKGYARIDECRDPAHFRAWLFKILRNLCLDHFKNVRRNSLSLSDVAETEEFGQMASAELSVTLADALTRLPSGLREAFLLKHDAGYSYDEIADLTAATPSAVKMRVHRARETLRALLIDRAVA
ncbi:MAG: RNA polymerase sigma factor [Gemmatimonadota bacterium]